MLLNPYRYATASAFDVEGDIAWHSLFWAEGSGFVALGVADGANVSTWPNEAGEADAVQATTGDQPSYLADGGAGLDNQPAISFDGTEFLQTSTFAVNPVPAVSVVIIGQFSGTGNPGYIFGGLGVDNRSDIYERSAVSAWRIFAGTNERNSTSALDSDPHLFVAVFQGTTASDLLYIDETLEASANAGPDVLTGATIGAAYTETLNVTGSMSLCGIYSGNIRTDGAWSDFTTWVSDHYGLTLA